LLSSGFDDISRGFTLLEKHMGLNAGRARFRRERAALGSALPQDDLVLNDRAGATIPIAPGSGG
jgi:hypothetical protein